MLLEGAAGGRYGRNDRYSSEGSGQHRPLEALWAEHRPLEALWAEHRETKKTQNLPTLVLKLFFWKFGTPKSKIDLRDVS